MDNVSDITMHILKDIREALRAQGEAIRSQSSELAGLRQEMHSGLAGLRAEMHTELTGLRDEMRGMRVELCARIDRTNARIDNFVEVTGSAHRAHGERLDQLDARVTRLEVVTGSSE